MGRTLCQSWSVMWGMPESAIAQSWWPYRERNLCSASSLRLSELSRSRAIRFRGLPSSIQALSTLSLKPFSWPALRKRNPGIRDSMSIRHSVVRSVPVTSSSWTLDFSHSTCITYSLWRSIYTDKSILKYLRDDNLNETIRQNCSLVPCMRRHLSRLLLWKRVFMVEPVTLEQKLTARHSSCMQFDEKASMCESSTKLMP